MKNLFIFVFFITSFSAHADYAWLVPQSSLQIRTGYELFKSSENYSSEGSVVDLKTGTANSEFSESTIPLLVEYGIAQYFSLGLKTGFVSGSVSQLSDGSTLLSGSGIRDTSFHVKWMALTEGLIVTPEAAFSFSPYSVNGLATDELPVGDGAGSILLMLHGGYRASKNFAFGFSPGIAFQSSGYNTLWLTKFLVSGSFSKFYGRVFADLATSLSTPANLAPLDQNGDPNSGGTFARLSPYRESFWMGILAGYHLSNTYKVDLSFSKSLSGKEAAAGWKFGLGLTATFNFYEPDKRIKIREVPLDYEFGRE